jgi:RNase P subunit RPR2
MNEETKRQIGMRGEMILESGIKTTCPRCPNNNAEIIKTKNFLIIDCDKCNFSMGSPRA